MKKWIIFLLIMAFCWNNTSCKKFLDAKPDKKLAIPSSLQDLQALLDDNVKFNRTSVSYGETSSGDYYITDNDYNAITQLGDRNTYIWGDEIIFDRVPNGWYDTYALVNTTNVVLENLEHIPSNPQNLLQWNNIKGSALFFRAKAFYEIAQVWALTYDSANAASALGIPLRLSSDFNQLSKRASLEQTYRQILSDLEQAIPLLPQIPQHVMRPSKAATYALLARIYLSMRYYAKAKQYAADALAINSDLLDFNSLNPNASNPIARFNKEVIFYSLIPVPSPLSPSRARIDSVLYGLYKVNDLRKTVFFKSNGNGTYAFKGSYDGTSNLHNGQTTDELYLIRAECFAREGNTTAALADLNTLLIKRWKTGSFIPVVAGTPMEALDLILLERRKELLMRGIRFGDIKRLNKEGAGIVLRRFINGQFYELPPNSNQYSLPLPAYIIELTGMPQNPR